MKQFHILLDGYEANSQQRVGSNVFAFQVLKALEKRSRKSKLLRFTVVVPNIQSSDLPSTRPGWRYTPISSLLYSQWSLPIYINKNRATFDLFFTTSHYAPRFCALPYISSVMDLGYIEYPHFFKTIDLMKLKLWTAHSVNNAQKVLTISKFTQQEVIKTYGVQKEQTFVAYPGNTLNSTQIQKTSKKLLQKWSLTTVPYILHVGTLQPRKNITRLVKAFSLLKLQPHTKHLKLVLAGKEGWLSKSIQQAISNSPHKADIIQTGFVTEQEKYSLLSQAKTVAMIGLHEGFGIPALECQNYGVVPVVSESSSLPEVVNGAGILVNPTDISSIAEGLLTALNLSNQEKVKMQKTMKKNLEKFTWENTADRIYKMILKTVNDLKKQ